MTDTKHTPTERVAAALAEASEGPREVFIVGRIARGITRVEIALSDLRAVVARVAKLEAALTSCIGAQADEVADIARDALAEGTT